MSDNCVHTLNQIQFLLQIYPKEIAKKKKLVQICTLLLFLKYKNTRNKNTELIKSYLDIKIIMLNITKSGKGLPHKVRRYNNC